MDDDVKAWRKAERERLIAARLAGTQSERETAGRRAIAHLASLVEIRPGQIVSFYWPFRGEFDLRAWVGSLIDRGVVAALQIVVEKQRPMIFRPWRPGAAMERGIWNIPVPADGPDVVPKVVIAPLVGYDREGYRLGYGGGYFDRTLASLARKPFVLGIGPAASELASIRPQPHDIPMDAIATDEQAFRR